MVTPVSGKIPGCHEIIQYRKSVRQERALYEKPSHFKLTNAIFASFLALVPPANISWGSSSPMYCVGQWDTPVLPHAGAAYWILSCSHQHMMVVGMRKIAFLGG